MGDFFLGSPYPHIYIFPRSKKTLFYYRKERYLPTGQVYYQNFFDTYKSLETDKLPKMATGPAGNETATIKEIERRIYVDLWNKRNFVNEGGGKVVYEITRKITIGFLRKEGMNVYKAHEHTIEKPNFLHQPGEMYLALAVDPKGTGKRAYLEGDASGYDFTTAHSHVGRADIPIEKMAPWYLVECTLHVFCTYENLKEGSICEGEEIEIAAQLVHKEKGKNVEKGEKTQLQMVLCRCPEPEANDPFESLRKQGKDRDIFVMPREAPNERHKAYVKTLQLYSNQVLARHKGMTQKLPEQDVQDGLFDFVKEDGMYTPQLGINYGMSIPVFQKTRKPVPSPTSELYANLDYDFSTFGQTKGIVDYIVSNYGMDEQTTRKHVIDRNFIYGQKEGQTAVKDIQGLKNIYEKIVQVFRTRFIEEAQRYVDFRHRWMPRPDLEHYHRGNLTVRNANLQVSDQNGSPVQVGNVAAGAPLPENAIIAFTKGADARCDISTETNRYRIASVTIGGQTHRPQNDIAWYVPLDYALKQECGDNANAQNYCDYMVLPAGGGDRVALIYYSRHNGVPYYMPEEDTDLGINFTGTGGKVSYNVFEQLLDVNLNDTTNWYSYNDSPYRNNPGSKPNLPTIPAANRLGGIGLDCSGLIWKCLLNTCSEIGNNEPYLNTRENALLSWGQNAFDTGNTRTRLIPLGVEYRNGDDLLVQAGDLIYARDSEREDAKRHIALALCTGDANHALNLDMHLTEGQRTDRYFTIIHNYGGRSITLENGTPFRDGFFRKTLKGPFRHWNVELNNQTGPRCSYVGRIYIWY
jgi:hypothetical protein